MSQNPVIKKGYKQTEIGVIPEDWEVKKIGEIVDISVGRDLKTKIYSSNENSDYKYPVFSNTVDNYGLYGYYKIPEYEGKSLTVVGRGIGLGKAFPRFGGFGAIGRLLVLFPHEKISNLFLSYYINHRIKFFFESGGIPQLTGVSISNYQICFPANFTEQSTIASILSDTDALIENLDKLIEKKKAIKQGTMQELLTGKRRLPGFSGEWKRKLLGVIGEFTGGGVDKKIVLGELPVTLLNFMDVYKKTFLYSNFLNHRVTANRDKFEKCTVMKGDIFFTPSSEMQHDVGITAVSMEDMKEVVYSYHLNRFRIFEDWDLYFKAYIFQTQDFRNQTIKHCEGSGKRYVLNLSTFREKLTVYYPEDKKEQQEIGRILYSIDLEIAKLEAQKEKYQSIKIGMMQQLLTGNIRVYGNQ